VNLKARCAERIKLTPRKDNLMMVSEIRVGWPVGIKSSPIRQLPALLEFRKGIGECHPHLKLGASHLSGRTISQFERTLRERRFTARYFPIALAWLTKQAIFLSPTQRASSTWRGCFSSPTKNSDEERSAELCSAHLRAKHLGKLQGLRNRNSGQRAASRCGTRREPFYPIRPGLTCRALRGAILRFRQAQCPQVRLLHKGIGFRGRI